MSGSFVKSARPTRPGAYFNWVAITTAQPQPGTSGIVAVPFTSDWGPSEVPVLLRSFSDYLNVFGTNTATLGYRDVYQAFQGEGTPGAGGAGAVLAYRMSSSGAAKATRAFTNTTPATALTLTAIYEGTRGNSLNVTVQAAAGIANTDQLIIMDGTTVLETYNFSHITTDVAALAATINANSAWVTAVSNISGIPLTFIANSPLSGGLGGESLITADWTAMLAAIQVQPFAVIAAEWPTADASTMTALLAWLVAQRAAGRMYRVAIGGLLNETSASALSRSSSFNHEAVVNIGQGSVLDSNLGQTLSTGMLAPRVAGIMVARGEVQSLTYARFQGLSILVGATDAEIAAAFADGLIVLARDSNLNAPVRIDKGVSTYVGGNTAKPYLIYRNPKFIATMDGIQTELQTFGEQQVIGQLTVSPSSRAFVRSYMNQLLKAREALGIIQPGWTIADDFNPPATTQDEFMQFSIGLAFGRSAEQVFFTCSVQ